VVPGERERPRPQITPDSRPFWTAGARGELHIQRCRACGFYIHPPAPLCPGGLGRDLSGAAVSGRGRVFSFTINHHRWRPDLPLPYIVALVELAEQPGLRVATNLVDCSPEQVHIDMPVEVLFEEAGDLHIPLFRPVKGKADP
jgi:uncharacterized OB-fold protein